MSYATALRCRKCGQEYPVQPLGLCDFCLSPLEVSYDYKAMARAVSREKLAAGPPSMWRYVDLLSVEGEVVDIGAGFTPLTKADRLGQYIYTGTSYSSGSNLSFEYT